MKFALIAVCGVLGVFARYGAGQLAGRVFAPPFPYGTFLINILGAFLIGVVYVLGLERQLLPPDLRVGIIVGFLGGFTTFSSYCLEAARLLEEGDWRPALLYFGLSPVLGLGAAVAGLVLTRLLTGGSA